jgi:hypothetical protein
MPGRSEVWPNAVCETGMLQDCTRVSRARYVYGMYLCMVSGRMQPSFKHAVRKEARITRATGSMLHETILIHMSEYVNPS